MTLNRGQWCAGDMMGQTEWVLNGTEWQFLYLGKESLAAGTRQDECPLMEMFCLPTPGQVDVPRCSLVSGPIL